MLPEGTKVKYHNHYGVIRFVNRSYMTICIRSFDNEKCRDVCLVVPPSLWHEIEPF